MNGWEALVSIVFIAGGVIIVCGWPWKDSDE